MLAPVTEAWPGEEALLDLGTESVRRWPEFAARLSAAAGHDAGLRTEGTVVAATGSGDRAELDTLAEHLDRLGRPVERLAGRALRRLEPALGPDVRGGLSVPDDLAVDNRMLLDALRAAAVAAGVRIEERTVAAVRDDGRRVLGVTDTAGVATDADAVLVSAGAHSSSLHPLLDGLVRPVKGEILRLGHRAGALPPPSRTVRALVDGRPVYAVPRDAPGHDLVIGATTSENGFDTRSPWAGCATCCATRSGCCRVSPSTRWWRRRPGCGRAAGQPAAGRRRSGRRDCWSRPGTAATGSCSRRSRRTPSERCCAGNRSRTRCARRRRTGSRPPSREGAGMRIWINGAAHDLGGTPAVVDALSAAGLPRTGVAVAVDGEVVPRARWADVVLADGRAARGAHRRAGRLNDMDRTTRRRRPEVRLAARSWAPEGRRTWRSSSARSSRPARS